MTKNDYRGFSYGNYGRNAYRKKGSLNQDPYHKSILEGFKNQNLTKIVS